MPYCVAANCKNSSLSGKGLRFHGFPLNDEKRNRLWILASGREESWRPSQHAKLCSEHFTADSYNINPDVAASMGLPVKDLRLTNTAIPKMFRITRPKPNQSTTVKKRKISDKNRKSRSRKGIRSDIMSELDEPSAVPASYSSPREQRPVEKDIGPVVTPEDETSLSKSDNSQPSTADSDSVEGLRLLEKVQVQDNSRPSTANGDSVERLKAQVQDNSRPSTANVKRLQLLKKAQVKDNSRQSTAVGDFVKELVLLKKAQVIFVRSFSNIKVVIPDKQIRMPSKGVSSKEEEKEVTSSNDISFKDDKNVDLAEEKCMEIKEETIEDDASHVYSTIEEETDENKIFLCNDMENFNLKNENDQGIVAHDSEDPLLVNSDDVQEAYKCLENKAKSEDTENVRTCVQCGQQFRKDNLAKCKIRPTKDNQDYCEKCVRQRTYNLEIHSKTLYSKLNLDMRSKEKPFSCEMCGETFLDKQSFNLHNITHTKEKHRCKFCEKAFSHKESLINHIRVHTKEKPFNGEVCGKAFSCKSNVYMHKRVHSKEKPFSCKMCDKAFSLKASLVRHNKIHTS